ncbi:hypothetical protein IDM40_08825 [Nocardiopsis sp. HNM0947]|uniref:Uncharacterized protein n=1 Tax=Nocardiopsis coralli TaxID=2772213 RepID=A0ABR9P4Y2_9ACTN|nr:hypothetical protein [Nocardiopsis coralli]
MVRRLLGGGVLCAALGALTVATAAPATASPTVWGNAQAWVSDGDLVSGYSTASHGDDHEDESAADEVHGALSEYAEIRGGSHTVVDPEGAHAYATVESATFRLEAEDLVDLGMIDVPDAEDDTDTDGDRDGDDGETDEQGDRPSALEDEAAPDEPEEPADEPENGAEADEPEDDPAHENDPRPGEDEEEPDEDAGEPQESESPEPEERPGDRATEAPAGGEARLAPLAPVGASDASTTDSVEFTVADVDTTVTAGFDGRTRMGFEHGEITAFGEPVGKLERGEEGTTVTDVLEVPGEGGGEPEEVPVSVRFVVNESTFEDEDPEWDGTGARSWLTAWVQVGDADEDNGFAVDLADSWALGSTHASDSGASDDKDGEAGSEERPVGHLPTTGGSLAALVTAACVAVGGGAAATYLARGRTTALDDRIED